ncbi:MAG: RNase H family protein [Myxococcaceae bacterium]
MSPLEVYCDGAGSDRVGRPGGWAFVVVRDDAVVLEGAGAAPKTTSLVMELLAAAEGLEAVHAAQLVGPVRLISDCRIALDVATGVFFPRPPRYRALCERLRAAFLVRETTAVWVKSHAGDRWNEEVDGRAARARDSAA